MLARQLRVAPKHNAGMAVFVAPNGGGDFAAVGGIDEQGADGVGPVVETDRILGAHIGESVIL